MATPQQPDMAKLMQLGCAFAASRTFLSAVELDLFTHLQTPQTAAELAAALHLHKRAVPDFPDALVALGVLHRDGDGPAAKYSNTVDTAAFLVRSSPRYMGGMLEMNATRLYRYWGHMTEALTTGELQNEAHPRERGTSMWDAIYATEHKLEGFLRAMAGANTVAHRAFASAFDFCHARTLLDVGGAMGQLCCEVAAQHHHMACTTMDLPEVHAIAQRNIDARGLHDRVRVLDADMWSVDLQPADVITMSFVLHDYDLPKKKKLLQKAHRALPPGGRFVAIETLIDDDRRTAVPGLLMSMNMKIETEGGFDYSARQFESWASDVGFTDVKRIELAPPTHCVVAYK